MSIPTAPPVIAMDQAAMNALTSTLQQMTASLKAIQDNQRDQDVVMEVPTGPRGDVNRRFETRITPFYGKPGESYAAFERHAKLICDNNGWPVKNAVMSVLSAMRDQASDITANMATAEGSYKSVDEFFVQLRKLFVTPAFKQVAQAAFHTRVQKTDESVRIFHGRLAKMWWDAYGEEEEPWRLDPTAKVPEDRPNARDEIRGYKSWRLITQFVKGIRERGLRAALKNRLVATGEIKNYTQALEMVLKIQVDRDELRMEDMTIKVCDQAPSFEEFDRPPEIQKKVVNNGNNTKRNDGVEPMEIGALSSQPRIQQRGGNQWSGQGWHRARGAGGGGQVQGQGARPKQQQAQPQKKQVRNLAGAGSQQQPAGKETRSCYGCGKPGHLKRDCPFLKESQMRHLDEGDDEGAEEVYNDQDHYEEGQVQEQFEGDDEDELADAPAFLSYNGSFVGN